MPCIVGDLAEAFGPVMPAPGEYLHLGVGPMHLDAVTVELDLVDPALTGRNLLNRCRQRASMEPGSGALLPIFSGFLR